MRLRRSFKIVLLLVVAVLIYGMVGSGVFAAKKPAKQPCRKDLASCPDQGCGRDFDPNLNKLKDIGPTDKRAQGEPTRHTLGWMKNLD